MEAQLNHRQAKSLFFDALDEALPESEERRLKAHLDDCAQCRQGWQQYAKTVKRVQRVEREKSPPTLATNIMKRVRRRRTFGHRGVHLAHAHYRFPVEIIIPILLAAMVAAFLLFSAP